MEGDRGARNPHLEHFVGVLQGLAGLLRARLGAHGQDAGRGDDQVQGVHRQGEDDEAARVRVRYACLDAGRRR